MVEEMKDVLEGVLLLEQLEECLLRLRYQLIFQFIKIVLKLDKGLYYMYDIVMIFKIIIREIVFRIIQLIIICIDKVRINQN